MYCKQSIFFLFYKPAVPSKGPYTTYECQSHPGTKASFGAYKILPRKTHFKRVAQLGRLLLLSFSANPFYMLRAIFCIVISRCNIACTTNDTNNFRLLWQNASANALRRLRAVHSNNKIQRRTHANSLRRSAKTVHVVFVCRYVYDSRYVIYMYCVSNKYCTNILLYFAILWLIQYNTLCIHKFIVNFSYTIITDRLS